MQSPHNLPCHCEHISVNPSVDKRHLPLSKGSYSVGYVDIMTEGGPQEGAFMRLYYPTGQDAMQNHLAWPSWVENDKYLGGLLTFAKCMAHRWPSWAPRKEFALFNQVRSLVRIAPSIFFPQAFRLVCGQFHIPIIKHADVLKNPSREDGKWPIVIFSHGIGCARFIYSQLCTEMASHGYMVAAVEHRDGSSCMSYYLDEDDTGRGRMNWIPHQRVEHDDDEYLLRNHQVNLRSAEVTRTLDVVTALTCGGEVRNMLDSQETSNRHHNCGFFRSNHRCNRSDHDTHCLQLEPYERAFDLSKFKDAIDVTHPVITGHSFGGATTLMALSQDKRFKCGVALDSWLFPMKDERAHQGVTQPLLFINTESFLNKENQQTMSAFKKSGDAERRCVYVRGSVHQNHLDLPYIIPTTPLKKMLGVHSQTCQHSALGLTQALALQFINSQLGTCSDPSIDAEILENISLIKEGFGLTGEEA